VGNSAGWLQKKSVTFGPGSSGHLTKWQFVRKCQKCILVAAAGDEIRLVRVSAAASLAGFLTNRFSASEKQVVSNATSEYIKSMVARPDDWSSHYNLGIYHQNQGNANKALNAYETAARLYPESLMPFINSSVLYSYIGNQAKAEENLKKVLEIDPDNEAASLNLGLLLAEQGKCRKRKVRYLLHSMPIQNKLLQPTTSVLLFHNAAVDEAVQYAKIAAEARPEEPKYAYTLAYYQLENNQKTEAEKTLKKLIADHPLYLNAVSFLADIYMRDGRTKKCRHFMNKRLKQKGIPEQDRNAIRQATGTECDKICLVNAS
jgi:tetratricopeptide (TPR) repeat protein